MRSKLGVGKDLAPNGPMSAYPMSSMKITTMLGSSAEIAKWQGKMQRSKSRQKDLTKMAFLFYSVEEGGLTQLRSGEHDANFVV